MKTTNFFTEMSKFAEHADLKFTISMKGENMTVTMLPNLKNGAAGQRVRDFTATGTVHELDEGFIPEMTKGVEDAGGFKTNTAQFSEAIKEANTEAEEAAKKKPASSVKKSAPAAKKSTSKSKKSAAPAAKKPAAKKSAAKKPAVKKSNNTVREKHPQTKKKPNPELTTPMALSPELQAICGTEPMGRTAVVKKVWAYIVEKKLKKKNGEIPCDDKLKKIFEGKEVIKMENISKGIIKHLTPIESYATAISDKAGEGMKAAAAKSITLPVKEKKVKEQKPVKEKKEKEPVAEAPAVKSLFD